MNLSKRLKKMIQIGYWPGFIVGMYPSQFAYQSVEVEINQMFKDTEDINLYFHIPFCKSKCTFCTFFSIKMDDNKCFKKYIDSLCEQLQFYDSYFEKKINVKSICFGGGTPNIIPTHLYKKLFDVLSTCNVKFDNELEPSMEISPELITNSYLRELRKIGIKRVSLGVQSLKSDIRNSINRKKNIDFENMMSDIRSNDLNINIDVISGIPGQNENDFMETLEEIVKYSPETISIYPLSGDGNSLFKREEHVMSTKEKYDLFDRYYDYLLSNDYRCESHVKFVKNNQDSTHQQKIYEYSGVETLGIGCGSRSYMNEIHFAMPYSMSGKSTIDEYVQMKPRDYKYDGFKMSLEENKRRSIIYGFFVGELILNNYIIKYGTSPIDDFPTEIFALKDNDLIIIDKDKIVLTKKGRKYTDLIGVSFWSNEISKQFRVM